MTEIVPAGLTVDLKRLEVRNASVSLAPVYTHRMYATYAGRVTDASGDANIDTYGNCYKDA